MLLLQDRLDVDRCLGLRLKKQWQNGLWMTWTSVNVNGIEFLSTSITASLRQLAEGTVPTLLMLISVGSSTQRHYC